MSFRKGLIIALCLAALSTAIPKVMVFAQDSSGWGYREYWEWTEQNNNQGNSNQTQNTQTQRQPQIIAYNVVVRGPVASSGSTTRYGQETFTIYTQNESKARDDARSQFRSKYHLRPDVGLTIMSVTPVYQ